MYKPRKYLIGEIFETNKGYKYKVIDYVKDNNRDRKIKFLNTGYETITSITQIKTGQVMDYLEKSVLGVGCLGYPGATSHFLYGRWEGMLSRCYNQNHDNYNVYGGRGIYVCDYWLNFENYKNDIEKKENYDKMMDDSDNWNIDKDLSNGKCYSNETTHIIKKDINIEESMTRNKIKKRVRVTDLKGNIIGIYKSARECSRILNVNISGVCLCCSGKQKTAKGYRFEYM